jgi:hypothetical protein
MPITLAPQYTQRSYFWTAWKSMRAAKHGRYQYDDDGTVYTVWFYDGPEVHLCTIWQGTVPDAVVQAGYSQEQNDADKADFLANYQATANKQLSPELTDQGRLPTASTRPVAPKLTFISPNWCDQTTWYGDALEVEDETALDSGDHTTYSLAHQYVIDAYHGKITFEDQLKDATGHSYRVTVKVNGAAKTERDPHLGTGGDYEINYAAGTITFFAPLQPTDVVTVTYHYARKGTYIIAPQAGKRLYIGTVEVQFSEDIVLNDTFIFQAYGLVDVFAPYLMQPPYNLPSGTKIPLGDPLTYKTFNDFLNDSNGAYPGYPAFGGSNWRALKKQAYIFAWDYVVGMTALESAYGMEIHIDLQHDAPCGGTYATATLYCTSEDE